MDSERREIMMDTMERIRHEQAIHGRISANAAAEGDDEVSRDACIRAQLYETLADALRQAIVDDIASPIFVAMSPEDHDRYQEG